MSRSGESVTRLDIRFPNSMYDRLQKIAIDDGAKIHHISKKAEISPTVLKLIQFALDNLEQIVSDSNKKLPDRLPDITINKLSDKLLTLSDNLSDKKIEAVVDRRLGELGLLAMCQTKDNSSTDSVPDNMPDKTPDSVPDNIPDNIDAVPDNVSDSVLNNILDNKNIPLNDSSSSDLALRPPHKNIEIAIAKFTKHPDLRDRVASGVAQGFKGSTLGDWLFDGGFLNAKNKRYDPATVLHFKSAIEWMGKI